MEYDYAVEELRGAKLGNSKILVDENSDIYLLLTIRRNVEVKEHRNKLFIDINEDSIDCLLVNYEDGWAKLFSVKHDVRRIRTNYRRIKKGIQKKVEDEKLSGRLLAKYGYRERKRVEDRLKKIATILAKIAKEYNADLTRENLKDLRLNGRKRSKQLNYRLSTFPYRKFISYIEYKFWEKGLEVTTIGASGTSITCPICGYADKKNRVDRENFRCKKCGFTFNAQYVACLNLFSRLGDGRVAIRGGRLYLVSRKAAPVVAVDVALRDAEWNEASQQGKSVQIPIVSKIPKI